MPAVSKCFRMLVCKLKYELYNTGIKHDHVDTTTGNSSASTKYKMYIK